MTGNGWVWDFVDSWVYIAGLGWIGYIHMYASSKWFLYVDRRFHVLYFWDLDFMDFAREVFVSGMSLQYVRDYCICVFVAQHYRIFPSLDILGQF